MLILADGEAGKGVSGEAARRALAHEAMQRERTEMPSTARRLAAHDRQAAAGDVFEAGPRMRTRARRPGSGWHDRGICSVAAATVAVQLGEQLARDHWNQRLLGLGRRLGRWPCRRCRDSLCAVVGGEADQVPESTPAAAAGLLPARCHPSSTPALTC